MQDDFISAVKAHPRYMLLNNTQQQRISCPMSIRWLQLAAKCLIINKRKTLDGLDKHLSISEDFKPIYKSILENIPLL